MSPGLYGHLRKTGTLPKSNRGIDRNRERDTSVVNQNGGWLDRAYQAPTQLSNNLALQAQPASLVRSIPNSELRSTSAYVKEHTWNARRRNERPTFVPKLAAAPRIPSREASGPSSPAQVSFADATTDSSAQFQLDWHPVSERQPPSTRPSAKNSNARTSTSPYAPAPAYDLPDLGLYNSHSRLYPNIYTREDLSNWLKMTPPLDSRTESPQNLTAKPTNTDKMPERAQVEGRLNQIREYINVTSKMMDSLSQSSDPRAQTQHEKLGRMLDDLYDSEQKLSKLMEDCQKYWRSNEVNELTAQADYRNAVSDMENGEDMREQELRKKVEESQRKLVQLQEHQAHLVGMQLHMRERLNEAREAQRVLLEEGDADNQQASPPTPSQATPGNVDRLERETEVLRGKLQQLENKKRHMDQLVQELQAVELVERGSCSSEGCRVTGQRDKAAELEAMKAQLAHLKALMGDALISRDDDPQERDPEDERSIHGHEVITADDNASYHDDEARHYPEQRSNPPTVEQIQAVTQELKEQQQLLQTARAELKRLKQAQPQPPPPAPSVTLSATPPPPQPVEKKRSNTIVNENNDTRLAHNKRRQLEDLMRKDQSQGLSVNQNGGPEWNGSRRDSNSQYSHTSMPGNVWPQSTNINGSQEHSMDGIAAENLMEIGSQPQMENGFGANFWSMPPMMTNQLPQGFAVGSAEYYKQLLLGSQAQQLQMMSTTIQQCCQLLWSQQREMQTMKAAIAQLQGQLRHSQLSEDQHSNLGRAVAGGPPANQHFSGLDPGAPLPPSSSLPNLVSLPSTSPTPASVTPAPCQQQQLNNQVPPGNRANNYWDNFRSYSRQNLLSGSSKSVTDYVTGTSAHATSSTDIATGITSTHMNNKCNRQHVENLPLPSGVGVPEVQYSLNLQGPPLISQQQQSQHSHPQQQDRESPSSSRREAQPQQSGQHQLDIIIAKAPIAILPLEVDESYASSETSDNESEAGACGNSVTISNNENIHNESQGLPEFVELSSTTSDRQSPLMVNRVEKYTVKQPYKNSLSSKSEASNNNYEVCNDDARDLVGSSCTDEITDEVDTTMSLPGNYCADDKEEWISEDEQTVEFDVMDLVNRLSTSNPREL